VRVGLIVLLVGALVWAGGWWMTRPRTPEALFRVRCAGCHVLRVRQVCEFDARLRPAIVDTMRRLHGADEAIDEREATLIRQYLEESLPCP